MGEWRPHSLHICIYLREEVAIVSFFAQGVSRYLNTGLIVTPTKDNLIAKEDYIEAVGRFIHLEATTVEEGNEVTQTIKRLSVANKVCFSFSTTLK